RFLAVAALDEFAGEPIEKRLTNWDSAQKPEIARRFLQALAEMPLPQAIDSHAGKKRILFRRKPIGERVDAAFAEIFLAVIKGPAGLYGMVLFRPLGVAAGKNVRLLEFQPAIHLHCPERWQIFAPLLAQLVQLAAQILVGFLVRLRHDLFNLVRV